MEVQNRLIEIINNAIKDIPYPNVAQGLFEPIEYTLSVGRQKDKAIIDFAVNIFIHRGHQPGYFPSNRDRGFP
jgi:hypothetical protein